MKWIRLEKSDVRHRNPSQSLWVISLMSSISTVIFTFDHHMIIIIILFYRRKLLINPNLIKEWLSTIRICRHITRNLRSFENPIHVFIKLFFFIMRVSPNHIIFDKPMKQRPKRRRKIRISEVRSEWWVRWRIWWWDSRI